MRRKLQRFINRRRAIYNIRRCAFWFVDIPRTSSRSIKVELASHFGPAYGKTNLLEKEYKTKQLLPDHLTAHEVRDLVGEVAWQNIFTFSIMRNSWDRVLSHYHYCIKANEIPSRWTFKEYVSRRVDADADTPYFKYRPSRMGATEFIFDDNGNCLVDTIIKFEDDRSVSFAPIAERLNVPELGQLHLQSS